MWNFSRTSPATAAVFLIAGCGSRSGLLPGGSDVGATASTSTTSTTAVPACSLTLEHRPLPAFAPGALCTLGQDGLPGVTMAAVVLRSLTGYQASGAAPMHTFFEAPPRVSYEIARVVAVRGEWLFAGDAQATFQSPDAGTATAQVIVADRSGKVMGTRLSSSDYSSGGSDLRLTGSDNGLSAYSFSSYPAPRKMEVLSPAGEVLTSLDGLDPITDPDDSGFLVVRDAEGPAAQTHWLDICTGELRPTAEAQREIHTSYVVWGKRLVFTDPATNRLVVEGATEVKEMDLEEPAGSSFATIFDFHPSGWALVTTLDTQRFTAIHAGTGERHSLAIALPAGYHRYDSYTGAFGPSAFDAVSGELRVTSTGGLMLPLRSAALGYLFTSADGKQWEKLGAPIGKVYSAKGVEAGGTFVHVGNDYAVSLPPWDPAPPGSGRIDYQSTQLVRPAAGQSLLVESHPDGQFYNHLYRLSADGGCLATSPISGPGVTWVSAVTGETIAFPPPADDPSSLSAALQWLTEGDVTIGSL